MMNEIEKYNAAGNDAEQATCTKLMNEIQKGLPTADSKIWHGSPVWFIDGNPIVGYSRQKSGVQLLFWSGQTFDEDGLKPMGKYKAAEARYTSPEQIPLDDLNRWLEKSKEIQWDYKNIVKRQGELLRLK